MRLALTGLVALGVAAWATATLARPVSQLRQIDVSGVPGSQAEVAIASDPSGRVLLAAANSLDPSLSERRGLGVDVYTSTDGGRSWRTTRPDRVTGNRCGVGDPAPAIGAEGLEVVAFLTRLCGEPFERSPIGVDVLFRQGPRAGWSRAVVAPVSTSIRNDKPTLTIDTWPRSPHRGRVYVAWSRGVKTAGTEHIVITWSDDGGASWSPAHVVSGQSSVVSWFASLAVGQDGALYLAWLDDSRDVFLTSSHDGGSTFARPSLVTTAAGPPNALCGYTGTPIPAQPRRCVSLDPSLALGQGRVFVTWTAPGPDGSEQDVFVRAFAPSLRPLTAVIRVSPPDSVHPSDQFLAASSYDRSEHRLWICFYDTAPDPTRTRARYVCTSSQDGIAWPPPVAAASVWSDETQDAALDFGYGDYAGVVAVHGVAHPIWADGRDLRSLGEEIYTTTLTADRLSRR